MWAIDQCIPTRNTEQPSSGGVLMTVGGGSAVGNCSATNVTFQFVCDPSTTGSYSVRFWCCLVINLINLIVDNEGAMLLFNPAYLYLPTFVFSGCLAASTGARQRCR